MKKILIIIVLTFFFCSQAQKEKIFIPKVDSAFEKFDIQEYNLHFEKTTDRILKKNNSNEYITMEPQSFGYIKEIFFVENPYQIISFYHKNGIIKQKGLSFVNGESIGLWYNFDENGKFTGTTNEDKDYVFGYQKVIDYCVANKIPLRMGYEDRNNDRKAKITKEKKDGVPVWSIAWEYFKKTPVENKLRKMKYVTPAGQRRLVTILLDGKTGKQLSKTDIQIHYIE